MLYAVFAAWLVTLGALIWVVRRQGLPAGRPGRPGRTSERRDASDEGLVDVPEDVVGLRQEVAALQREVRTAFRHLALVRYDAFADMGGHLSWSVALLDDAGDGVLITSIHGRSEARTYAKSIRGWASEQELSPEETDAITHARPSASRQ